MNTTIAIAVLPLATYYFIMSVTPGPNNVMLTTSGVNFGFNRTLPHIFGIVLGCAVQTYLLCLGFGVVFNALPWLRDGLKWVGCAYLLYLSWKLVGSKVAKETDVARPLTLPQAATFQFVNPKAWVKATTTATLFLPSGVNPWFAGLVIFTVCSLANAVSASIWAGFGVAIRQFLSNKKFLLAFNWTMALLLIGTIAFILK
jgi:threonine/homoserine/homoserine lactone efflux protein